MKYYHKVFSILILFQVIHSICSKEVHFWLSDGEECLDECAKRKEVYNWCNTVQSGWRKCSVRDGFDAYDRPCLKGCNSNATDSKGCKVNIPGWSSGATECSEVRTIPDSYTKNGELCRNTCGKYGKTYYWCYTVKNWDYCTPTTYVTFKDTSNASNYELTRTISSYKRDNEECKDECTKRDGTDYNWCHTVNHGWRKCSLRDGYDSYDRPCLYGCDSSIERGCSVKSPGWFGKTEVEIHECSDVKIVPVSYTNTGELCNNTCHQYGKDYFWCYTQSSWDYCTPSPPVVKETIYNYNYKLIANENSENDNICVLNDPFCTHIKDCSKKSKRAVNQCINVADVIERYFTFLAAVAGCAVLRILVINPRTYRSDDPITSAYFRTISRTTIRLEAIEANLDASHYNGRNNVQQVFRSRRDFTEWGLSNVRDFRNQYCAEPRDERGHIVADVFGGYPEFYNVFPQARNVNRGRGSIWRGLENLMARFLSAGQPGGNGGHVIWRVAFYYIDDEDLRPLEIWVRAVFYDADGNEIIEGEYIADQHILDNRE